MSYQRVIPRDLFNEAKLLKCLGRLSLKHLDGELPDNVEIIHDDSEIDGFDICQNEDDGSIYVSNLHIIVDGETLPHSTGLNSRANYPLTVIKDDNEYYVFLEDGRLGPDFLTR